MTNRADRRPRAFEKLWPVTTHARIMIGVILDIRETRRIFRWYLMTGITGSLMLLCGMGEFRIISRG